MMAVIRSGINQGATLATVEETLAVAAATLVVATDTQTAADATLIVATDTLAEATEIERHLHNRERWFGISGDQSGTDWAVPAGLTVFQAKSGNGVFGADANDEAKLLGTSDTPAITGMTKYDFHRIVVHAASNANPYVLRIVYGTGTMADAELAEQYTDIMLTEARKGSPVDIIMERATCGSTKMWLRAKSATNDATIDFYIGIHEYPE